MISFFPFIFPGRYFCSFGFLVCDDRTVTRPGSGDVLDHLIANDRLVRGNLFHIPCPFSDDKVILFENLQLKYPD
jgi:hypothetical protein